VTPEQAENRSRVKHGAPTGMYESWFLKANEPNGGRALWLRFTLLSPRGRPEQALAETWAIVFDRSGGKNRAAKQSFAMTTARIADDGSRVEIGDCVLEPGHTVGSMVSGHGPVRWDLSFTTTSFLHRPYPRPLYDSPLPKHKQLTPYPDEVFDGWIELGDQRFEVTGWPGMQGHNWGSEHTHLYVWCHGNVLGTPGTWFECAVGRVKLGPLVLPWLGVATLAIDGRRIHFDGLGTVARCKVSLERQTREPSSGQAPGWGFSLALEGPTARLEAEAAGDRGDFVGLTYHCPTGRTSSCLNSSVAHVTLTLRERGLPPVRLESDALALEVGTHRTDHGIRMLV